VVGELAEGLENKFASSNHLVVIVGRDIGREQFGFAGFVLRPAHRIGHQRNRFPERREGLVSLRFVILDEVATQPEVVASVGKRARTEPEFGLDDRADNKAAVHMGPAEHLPEIGDRRSGPVEQAQIIRRYIEIMNFGVFNVAHALVVAYRQGQEGRDHRASVSDVAVEQLYRVGQLDEFLALVRLVNQGVHATRKIIGRGNFDIGAGRRLCCKVGGRFNEIAEALFWLHVVSNQHMAAAADQFVLGQIQIYISIGLVQCHACSPCGR